MPPFELDDTPEQAPAKQGNWVPMNKALSRYLPQDRQYTPLEAMFSVTCDYDNGNTATVSGYAALWRWSRNKVERFLERSGVVLRYPDDTSHRQNQRGQITMQIPSRYRADDEQILAIDSRWLRSESGRQRADVGQKKSRRQVATIKPEPKPNPIVPAFVPSSAWNAYLDMRRRKGKPPTEHAIELILRKLDAMHARGINIAAVLDASTINGWSDVYEPKVTQPGQQDAVPFVPATDPARQDAIRRRLAELEATT